MYTARRLFQGIMAIGWWVLVGGVWNWIAVAQANSDPSGDIIIDSTTPLLMTLLGAFLVFFAFIGFVETLRAGSIWRSLGWSVIAALVGILGTAAGGLVWYLLEAEDWLAWLLVLLGPLAALVTGAALGRRSARDW